MAMQRKTRSNGEKGLFPALTCGGAGPLNGVDAEWDDLA